MCKPDAKPSPRFTSENTTGYSQKTLDEMNRRFEEACAHDYGRPYDEQELDELAWDIQDQIAYENA